MKVYQSILHAIALGNTAPTSIAQFCGLDTRHVYPYLESMIRLGLVEKEVPLLGSSRQGIYRIRDRVFDFWYCYVFPRRQEIETGHSGSALPDMNPFFGRQFEAFVRDEYAGMVLPDTGPATGGTRRTRSISWRLTILRQRLSLANANGGMSVSSRPENSSPC